MSRAPRLELQELVESPAYRIPEAAEYLGIPVTTLRAWARGQAYYVQGRRRLFRPILRLPAGQPPMLSFNNLLEAHVVNALRRYGLAFQKIRKGLNYLERKLPSKHPLLDRDFLTDGWDLFISQVRSVVNITLDGQLEMCELIAAHLRRIDRDQSGMPIRLYPFTRVNQTESPRTVVIDPRISFGRPVIAGTGIAVEEITERHKAGESMEELARDYERPPGEIEEAIRFREAA